MSPLRLRRSLLVLMALAPLAAVACSGAPPLSVGEYTELANRECSSLEDASDAFRKAQDPSFKGEQVSTFVHRVAERLRSLVDNLDALEPPPSMEADAGALVDVLSQYADGLDELGAQTRSGQTFQEVLEERTEEVAALNELASQATLLVGNLSLVDCILPA